MINGGTGPSAIGGTYQGGVSIIGNTLTDVLVKLTNKSTTGASDMVIIFEWTNE